MEKLLRHSLLAALVAVGCTGATASRPEPAYRPSPRQVAFLEQVERDTFKLFWKESHPTTGLTPDRVPGDGVASIAAVGFALTSYPVGVERGFVSRADAAARTLVTLETLWRAPQGRGRTGVAGYRGFFYHFLDVETGLRHGRCELSTIDTALLMAGVLASRAYFERDDLVERTIRDLADRLYRRVDWPFASSPARRPLLSMGWTPEEGFIDHDWSGYNEAMILYVLALGSPTHPVDPSAWELWTRTYRWDESSGQPHVAFGPLFGHQYSHVWIDFRGIKDRYMRRRGIDYFVNSTRATYANRAYCVANPKRWKGYGDLVWGLTASDGPLSLGGGGAVAAGLEPFRGYWARGAHGDTDDGTIAPTAVGGSVPFAPELAIPTLVTMHERFGARLYGDYGFRDAFNLSFPGAKGPGWFAEQYVAIDQGPILLMIENYRTGFVWQLMKRSDYLVAGIHRAGFAGGWLATHTAARP